MAYPTFPQLRGSRFEPLDDVEVAVTEWGDAETSTGFGANKPGRYLLVHRLTAAQVTTLESDYDTNFNASFSFTWDADSTAHSCYYAGPPQIQWEAPDQYRVEVVLMRDVEIGSILAEGYDDSIVAEGGADDMVFEGGQ